MICKVSTGKLIEGLNTTVLVYGSSRSGRDHILLGKEELTEEDEEAEDKIGLVARTMEQIFRRTKEYEEIRDFFISCTCYELDMDQIRDLVKEYMDEIAPF